jgi:hypothetical protein
MKSLRKKNSDFVRKLKIWFSANFTDKSGRVDTGRIGQVVGLFLLMTVTYFMIYVIIFDNIPVNLKVASYLSGAGGLTMMMYRAKEFAGTAGSCFERREYTRVREFKNLGSFIKRNFTVGRHGRLNTGRIGQFLGLIALTTITCYAIWVMMFQPLLGLDQSELDPDKMALVMGEGGLPMLLYRAKEFANRAISAAGSIGSSISSSEDNRGH